MKKVQKIIFYGHGTFQHQQIEFSVSGSSKFVHRLIIASNELSSGEASSDAYSIRKSMPIKNGCCGPVFQKFIPSVQIASITEASKPDSDLRILSHHGKRK